MGALTDEFLTAAVEWAHEVDVRVESSIVLYAMSFLGYGDHIPVGGVDPFGIPADDRLDLSMADLMGHYTLDQMVDRIEYLVTIEGMREDFLIAGMIQAIERELQFTADPPTEEQAQYRANAQRFFEGILNDPVRTKEWIAKTNATREPWQPPAVEEDLRRIVEHIEEMNQSVDQRLPGYRHHLEVWQRLTTPIISQDRLSHWVLFEWNE